MDIASKQPFDYISNGKITSFEDVWMMSTPGALVRVLAGALGVPKATVAQHDRNLLVAGLRSRRGRGWAAPSVTPRDVAHLVTAILGSALVKDSVTTVRRYKNTRPNARQWRDEFLAQLGIDELAALPREHSFVDALEALFIAASTGSLEKRLSARASEFGTDKLAVAPEIIVEALAPGTSAYISIEDTGSIEDPGPIADTGPLALLNYVHPSNGPGVRLHRKRGLKAREGLVKHRRVDADLEQYRRISEKTILRAAEVLIANKEEK